jgi:hypothetical protein
MVCFSRQKAKRDKPPVRVNDDSIVFRDLSFNIRAFEA